MMDEKDNKSKKGGMLSLLAVVCSLSLMINIACIVRMSNLESQLSFAEGNLSNEISLSKVDMINQFGVYIDELEAQNSIVASFEQEFRGSDFENGTYTVDIRILPKEFVASPEMLSSTTQANASASICVGDEIFGLEFLGSVYGGTLTLPILWSGEKPPSAIVQFCDEKSTKSEEINLNHMYFEDVLPLMYPNLSLYSNNSNSTDGKIIHIGDEIPVEVYINNKDYSLESLALYVEVNGERVYQQDFSKNLEQANFDGNQGKLTLCPDKKDISVKITDDTQLYLEGECNGFFVRSYLLLVDGRDPQMNGENGACTEYSLNCFTLYYDADGNILSPTYDASGNILPPTSEDFNTLVAWASSTDLPYGG